MTDDWDRLVYKLLSTLTSLNFLNIERMSLPASVAFIDSRKIYSRGWQFLLRSFTSFHVKSHFIPGKSSVIINKEQLCSKLFFPPKFTCQNESFTAHLRNFHAFPGQPHRRCPTLDSEGGMWSEQLHLPPPKHWLKKKMTWNFTTEKSV